MIIISSRKGFTKPNEIAKSLEMKDVDLLDPRPANWSWVDNDSLLEEITGKNVAILIHGYNNTFEELCKTYHEIENRLLNVGIPYEKFIGYAWPGGQRVLSYFAAKKRAKQLKDMEGNLFKSILDKAKRVDIIAHSLGCYLVLEFIKKASLRRIYNIHLMAAAIQYNKICENNDLYSPTKKCKGLWVFRSEDDGVLSRAFKMVEGHALGCKGPAYYDKISENVQVVNCSNLPDPIKHKSYKNRSEIYKFIQRYPEVNLISGNEIGVNI